MVFHCRCFSFLLEENDETEYETKTQTKSTTTGTFYTARSDLNRWSAHNVQANTEHVPNLADKPSNLRVFAVAELNAATENFSIDSKIGEGDFGTVYKGVIKSLEHPLKEVHVAVKLAKSNHSYFHGLRWRVREINVLGTVEHPNLVKLIGYCAEEREEGTQLYFVYEYMANRSARDHLSADSETPLSWNTRLRMAQDAARVLTYLHEEMEFQMIFKNFKSSNVLLDDQWNCKLSDFGVPQILGPDGRRVTHISTKIAGSVQYAPPEYIAIGHFTSKSDVWCYGIFLYELITGRHPLELITSKHGLDFKQPFINEQTLLDWVKPYLGSKKIQQIIDPRLEGNYPLKSAQKLCIIANKCLCDNPKSRPKMSEVLEMVNQLIWVPSKATSSTSNLVPQVVVGPNKANVGPVQGEKTNDDVQLKKSACLPQIRHLKCFKLCSKKGCCVSLH